MTEVVIFESCESCGNEKISVEPAYARLCTCLTEREAKLLEVIKLQQEALAFYSNEDSWISFGHLKKERIDKSDCEVLEKPSYDGLEIDYQFSCGGKKARAAIEKTKKMMEELK